MTEVYRETEDAIARVIEEGRPVELEPANSYIRRVQHQPAAVADPMRRVLAATTDPEITRRAQAVLAASSH